MALSADGVRRADVEHMRVADVAVFLVGISRIVPMVHPHVVEDVVVQFLIRVLAVATNHTSW